MTIETKISQHLGISQYKEIRNFYSRRNRVYLLHGQRTDGTDIEFIYKEFVAGDINREYEYLQRLNGLPVPAVMARGDRALALSYISGKTMLECLEEAESRGGRFEGYIDAFLDFLSLFYSAIPGQIYGDVNLRNFIAADERIYGVDLEEAGPGEIYTDIGRAAAFLLTYSPVGTGYKKEFSETLLAQGQERFSFNKDFAARVMEAELITMEIRRGQKVTTMPPFISN